MKEKKLLSAYSMTSENYKLFLDICKGVEATSSNQRSIVLEEMFKVGKINGIVRTHRGKEQFVKDCAKKLGKILWIKEKKKDE